MILSSDKSPAPTFHVQVPPAIHVHASEVNPTINVQPSELRQTIEVKPAAVAPVINIAPAEPQIVIQKDSRGWTFAVNRDEAGRISIITATPM